MKTLIKGALLLSATLGIVTTQAQNVDEIVGKHIEALGGKSVLNSIKSIYVESTVEFMGNEAPSTTYILNGKGYKNELDFNGTKIIQCVTEKGGWAINPMAGATTAQAIPAACGSCVATQDDGGMKFSARGAAWWMGIWRPRPMSSALPKSCATTLPKGSPR